MPYLLAAFAFALPLRPAVQELGWLPRATGTLVALAALALASRWLVANRRRIRQVLRRQQT